MHQIRIIILRNNIKQDENVDLYVMYEGNNPQPPKFITTLNYHVGVALRIPDYDLNHNPIGYNAKFKYFILKHGQKMPKTYEGITFVEFNTNQIYLGLDPNLRDTFNISCIPAGIGVNNILCDNGQCCRNKALELSREVGYTKQQSYSYNYGVTINPSAGTNIPSGNLLSVSCLNPKGYPSEAVGYPLDIGLPKQQTGNALTNYEVIFSLPKGC